MSAIRALLSKIIDYAGLFPPSSLSLSETLRNFRRYLDGPTNWLVGKIVLPSALLTKIDATQLDQFTNLPVTIVARQVMARQSWLTALGDDVLKARSFATDRPQVAMGAFEVLLPEDVECRTGLMELLKSASSILETHPTYFEVPAGPRFNDRLALLGDCLSGLENRSWGLKLRTGGTKPEQFPPLNTVARAILLSRSARIPLKFTAGLHHPIRHWDEGLQTAMHGFINVLLGGILAHAHKLSSVELTKILEEQDPTRFWFHETDLGWGGLTVSVKATEEFRQSITGFGSCSVEEPWDDLQALGWTANGRECARNDQPRMDANAQAMINREWTRMRRQ
jgi:hypothetical protein